MCCSWAGCQHTAPCEGGAHLCITEVVQVVQGLLNILWHSATCPVARGCNFLMPTHIYEYFSPFLILSLHNKPSANVEGGQHKQHAKHRACYFPTHPGSGTISSVGTSSVGCPVFFLTCCKSSLSSGTFSISCPCCWSCSKNAKKSSGDGSDIPASVVLFGADMIYEHPICNSSTFRTVFEATYEGRGLQRIPHHAAHDDHRETCSVSIAHNSCYIFLVLKYYMHHYSSWSIGQPET